MTYCRLAYYYINILKIITILCYDFIMSYMKNIEYHVNSSFIIYKG